MPIFEFRCEKCTHEFERVTFGSDEDPVTCPECGASETKKLLSVFSCSGISKDAGASCGPSSGGFS